VLAQSQITLIAPARLGTRLVAEGTERHRADRSAIYDVRVTSEAGDVIAEFRGQVRSIPGKLAG
jgi:acyl-CoA thioesterase